MALQIAQIAIYFEGTDVSGGETRVQTTFNRKGAPVGSGATASGFPSNLALRVGVSSTRTTAGDLFYTHTEASDLPGYKILSKSSPDLVKQAYYASAYDSSVFPLDVLMEEFATAVAAPGETVTLSGTWTFYTRRKTIMDSDDLNEQFRIRVYRRYYDEEAFPPGYVEELLTTITQSSGLTEFVSVFNWGANGTFNSDDRLVIKYYGYFEEIGATT